MAYILDCVSDTHTMHTLVTFPTPEMQPGDVWILLHAGDFTYQGTVLEALSFSDWLRAQPHHHKVVIAGNHECLCDPVYVTAEKIQAQHRIAHYLEQGDVRGLYQARARLNALSVTPLAKILKDSCTYLQEKTTVIDGLRIYGSPYSKRFHDWGFQTDLGDGRWRKMPKNTDVALIHGPPYGYGDRCPDMRNRSIMISVGCTDLLARLQQVKPTLTVFGHIHEGAGCYEFGSGLAVNASILDGQYKPRGTFTRVVLTEDKKISNVQSLPYHG